MQFDVVYVHNVLYNVVGIVNVVLRTVAQVTRQRDTRDPRWFSVDISDEKDALDEDRESNRDLLLVNCRSERDTGAHLSGNLKLIERR